MSYMIQTAMPIESDNHGMNAHSFCTVSGNPPVWGCTLCGWRLVSTQCDPQSSVPPLEQARFAHVQHDCAGINHQPAQDSNFPRLRGYQLVLTKCNRGKSLIFEALSTRMHHEKLSGDLQKVAGDGLDDVADMVRYAILTWSESSSKPREVAIEQKLEEYRANGMDEHSLYIYRCRMERENRQTEEPVYIGRRRHGIIIRR
jgi:hypothetical protein